MAKVLNDLSIDVACVWNRPKAPVNEQMSPFTHRFWCQSAHPSLRVNTKLGRVRATKLPEMGLQSDSSTQEPRNR